MNKKIVFFLIPAVTLIFTGSGPEIIIILLTSQIILSLMFWDTHITLTLIFLELLSMSLPAVLMFKGGVASIPLTLILLTFCVMAVEAVIGLSILVGIIRFYPKEKMKLSF